MNFAEYKIRVALGSVVETRTVPVLLPQEEGNGICLLSGQRVVCYDSDGTLQSTARLRGCREQFCRASL